MNKIQFKCTLLTDVILNERAATEGNQSTLDFIPGNCFLGIVAKRYEQFAPEQRMALFHNSKVRYGDAHPCVKENDAPVMHRTLRVPASMYYPKLKTAEEVCYIHHFYSRAKDHEGKDGHPQQLKQCRKGFYTMKDGLATCAETPMHFAIKSAYDRELRRAKDEQMYGYQSLEKGRTFLFEVEVDDPTLESAVVDSLVGKHRVGRSRTAQYGLVEIEKAEFVQSESRSQSVVVQNENYQIVYADGRLIFMDDAGMPTFRPEAKDFGLEGEIIWHLSQVRTFQYAPWNFKRQTRDADRCGIEKGSVFVIKTQETPTQFPSYVGNFRNEGFGKVIFNPDFLDVRNGTNGVALYQMKKAIPKEKADAPVALKVDAQSSPLILYLVAQAKREEATAYIYEKVNQFVSEYVDKKHYFKDSSFASQWGNIRSIAMKCKDAKELVNELFKKEYMVHHYATATDPEGEDRYVPGAYLSHGVAMENWKKRGVNRINLLEQFIIDAVNKEKELNVELTIEAVVNLASEMSKKCKRK